MISSPENPPERPEDGDPELERSEVDTRAPLHEMVSARPTGAEDPQVQRALAIARTHADLLARVVGDQLVGVYVVGSTALGDAWPHSDVDTFAVLTGALPGETVLRRVHNQLATAHPGVSYDTTYVLEAWLHEHPTGIRTSFSRRGILHVDETGSDAHAIGWLELSSGITAAGRPVDELDVAVDVAAAAGYARTSLSQYWRRVGAQLAAAATGQRDDAPLGNPAPVVWAVLSAAQVAAFIDRTRRARPGDAPRVVTKSEAGEWLRNHLPEHADLAERALRRRRGGTPRFTVADAIAAAALIDQLVIVANSR